MNSVLPPALLNRYTYLICQLTGWLILYVVICFSAWLRPIFTPVELLYALVLIGSSAIGSHMIRQGYKQYLRQRTIWQQVLYLICGSLLVASVATILLLILAFSLAQLGVTNPIPAAQRWFVARIVFTGNFFNMLMALLFWSALYFSITKVRQLRQTTELLKSSQLDALINQLNPHFLFNAINNIRALILEDPKRARDMLARLADMLRYSLSKDDKAKVTLTTELAIVDEYIALCSIQYEDRLRFAVDVADECQRALLPKLLLQLCVENAIKHGISCRITGGSINVSVRQDGNMLAITIINDGNLDHTRGKQGLGLQNIRQRLELLYPGSKDTSLALRSEQNKVFTRILLPLEY